MLYCHVLAYCHLFIFFFNDTATTEIYTLSLHDALPILKARRVKGLRPGMRLDDAAERIVRVRLGELCALAAKSQRPDRVDRKSTRLNSSHANISYAVFCLKKKKKHRV